MKRIRCLLKKETAQLLRDRRLMGMLIVAPLIQLLVIGFAANTDVREIDVLLRDREHSFASREFARAIGASGYLRTAEIQATDAADTPLLVSGRAGIVVVIPPGFGKHLANGQPAAVQALVDGADSNFAVQGVNYLQKAARVFSDRLIREAARAGGVAMAAAPAVAFETRVWYNPDLLSAFYMVPAIMALLLMVTTMMVTSMALVKEREDGTIEQLIVTPLRPAELMIGKLLPFVVIGFVMVSLALPVNLFIFRIPLRGSLLTLYALSGLFLLTTLEPGVDAAQQVVLQDRLGQIIVGAEAHAGALIHPLALGGEKDEGDRPGSPVAAEGFEDLIAVQLRHHDVTDHEVRRLASSHVQADQTVGSRRHLEMFAFEDHGQFAPHLGMIFDDQDFVHRS